MSERRSIETERQRAIKGKRHETEGREGRRAYVLHDAVSEQVRGFMPPNIRSRSSYS